MIVLKINSFLYFVPNLMLLQTDLSWNAESKNIFILSQDLITMKIYGILGWCKCNELFPVNI